MKETQTMITIIAAGIVASSLYFSIHGSLWAIYVILGILSLNVFLTVLGVSFLVGFQKTYLLKPLERLKEIEKAENTIDTPSIFVFRVLLLISVWHIYTLDYLLFAGITGTTVTISLLAMLFKVLDSLKENDE
jgi:hypothetical protein